MRIYALHRKRERRTYDQMKKIVSLVMAGVMVLGTLCIAAGSPCAKAVVASCETPEQAVERQAAAVGMTAAEYRNNVIVSVPGLEDTLTVGQGGHVEINGAASNYTITMVKPNANNVAVAKAKAAAENGKIVSFFGIKACRFKTAKVNFYVKGMKAGKNILVYQYVDGAWKSVTVNEIREDHVVVTLVNNSGQLLMIEK